MWIAARPYPTPSGGACPVTEEETIAMAKAMKAKNATAAIVVEASLSFLGLGAPPDEPSWGGMLNPGAHAIQRAPWIAMFPGLAISPTVFGLNMVGGAARDLTDVKLRGWESQQE
jgi:ABC-type dipeptide/oligopeptide/nickel transport system permease subunit